MIKIVDSTIFNANAECIVNTINCVGVMGKGLALEFALRYPKLEEKYIEECNKKLIHTGKVYFYNIDGQKIINFPTKYHFKYPSKIEWISDGLQYFVDNYKKWNLKSIAFPLLGASNGGLDPKVVQDLMIRYLSKVDIDVYICRSILNEGKELEMVKTFKETPTLEIKQHVRLNSKQVMAIDRNKNKVNRFFDIARIDGIGIETYKSLFRFFYDNNLKREEQLSLF